MFDDPEGFQEEEWQEDLETQNLEQPPFLEWEDMFEVGDAVDIGASSPTGPSANARSWETAFGNPTAQGGRRLRRKTHPSLTSYANVVPLGTRAE